MGAGLNNFRTAYRDNVGSAPLYHGSYVYGAHNVYLEVAVEMGVAGIVLLLTGDDRANAGGKPLPEEIVAASCAALSWRTKPVVMRLWRPRFLSVLPGRSGSGFLGCLLALAVRTAPVEEIASSP